MKLWTELPERLGLHGDYVAGRVCQQFCDWLRIRAGKYASILVSFSESAAGRLPVKNRKKATYAAS